MSGPLGVVFSWPYEMVPWSFWSSMWGSDVRKEDEVILLRPCAPDPAMALNMAVKVALDRNCEEILFLDQDHDVPPQVLKMLRRHNKDIVGTLSSQRPYPHQWAIYRFGPDGKRETIPEIQPLQKVDVITGNGCFLAKAKVFREIEPPWFKAELSADGCTVTAESDLHFFKKVQAAGFECFVDATVESTRYTPLALNSHVLGRKIDYMEIHEPEGVLK